MKHNFLAELDVLLEARKHASPTVSYTAKLLKEGPDSILKKIGEESAETIIAAKSDNNDNIIHEVTDLWFHTIVLLKYYNLNISDILAEFEKRFNRSGLEEKSMRQN